MNRVWIDYANFLAQNGYKKAVLVLASLLFLKTAAAHSWLARLAQFWEQSPFMHVQIPAPASYFGSVCCWFSPLLPEVFLWVLIIVLLKNQHFQIPIQLGMDGEEPLCGFPTSYYLLLLWRPSFLLALMASVAWQQNKKSRRHAK